VNNKPLNDRMQEWCDSRSKVEIVAALEEARIPACSMYTLDEVLSDEHIKQMGYYHYTDYPGLPKQAPIVETPFRMSETPATIRSRPPTVGEHTDEIMKRLGYSADEIASLHEKQVI
jgi:crotonobetainyl-CoA:carnitine CoA-transferase CaiB-like acyl-CoA transferase